MNDATEIRRLPDGSMDLRHYERIGRVLRSQAMSAAAGRALTAPGRLIARFTAALARRLCRFSTGGVVRAR